MSNFNKYVKNVTVKIITLLHQKNLNQGDVSTLLSPNKLS